MPDGDFSCTTRQHPPTDWSLQQEQALDQILQWHSAFDAPFFYLAGWAGVGKTTLAGEVARLVGGKVVFGAFTGKAASVMRAKGCTDAQTLDKLVYWRPCRHLCTKEACDAKKPPCKTPCQHHRIQFFAKRFNPDGPISNCSLTTIDEVSMVNEQLGEDLLRYERPILVIGDPGQLPPPQGCGFFTNRQPDFLLREIHRQAAGNPIIQMASIVRTGGRLAHGAYGSSAVKRRIDPQRMLDFDQIIVGTHRTRRAINAQYREILGIANPLPTVGERLLCLRNSRDGKPLYNGTVWTVVDANKEPCDGFIGLTVEDEDGLRVNVNAPVDLLLEDNHEGADYPGDPFCWGYALTAHKSQGSQWNRVLVFDESGCFGADQWRWLYTAITRAVDSVVVVRGAAA